MTEKQLRQLTRSDLLKLLVELSSENKRLQEELDEAKKELASRRLDIKESESLAEAALRLGGVFKAADEAVKIYIENIVAIEKAKMKPGAERNADNGREKDRY